MKSAMARANKEGTGESSMRTMFGGYYRPSDSEFEALWKNAIFIFDTNVLLNLYRYQSATRDTLFGVVERLSDRVWIPYHVGLEFQRNRMKVIAEQHRRFSEVRGIVNKSLDQMQSQLEGLQLKKRHSHINPDLLVEELGAIRDAFFKELDSSEEKSISVSSKDQIRERIDGLFSGRIGSKPKNQEEVDDWCKEGENRFRHAIPPGFKDSIKEEGEEETFAYSGITYQRKFGDLIIWKQILAYVGERQAKDVIFVTDDSKSDWWWKVSAEGLKTIGVRPELVDEISRFAAVERFYAYNTESFLGYANRQLDARVTNEAIEEVREVSSQLRRSLIERAALRQTLEQSAETAVTDWLLETYNSVRVGKDRFPDFVCREDGREIGFEVKLVKSVRSLRQRLPLAILNASKILNENDYFRITIVLVCLDSVGLDETIALASKRHWPQVRGNVNLLVGKGELSESGQFVKRFIPYHQVILGAEE